MRAADLTIAPIYHPRTWSINVDSRSEKAFRCARALQFNTFILFLNMVSAPFPYIGGKRRASAKILEIFPEHVTYCEVFAGSARLLFDKKPSSVEILNDLDQDVVNFFRVCQLHHGELLRCLKFTLASRKWFEWYKNQNPEGLTDIQRASRFIFLQKNAFGGLVVNRNYHYCVAQPPNFNPRTLPRLIENAYQRLARVQIENLPYEEILKRYDRPTTLFYLDPPYWNRALYNLNFSEADFIKLEGILRNIRGKFVLSLNDLPPVRQLFRRYSLRPIQFAYSAQKTAGKVYRELLITNFRVNR